MLRSFSLLPLSLLVLPAIIGWPHSAVAAHNPTASPHSAATLLVRRQAGSSANAVLAENRCLLNHYCSPGNETFFEVNSDIAVAWSATSPYLQPSSSLSANASVFISLEDPSTHRSIWNATMPNPLNGAHATNITVTEDMLDKRDYRLVDLVVRQAHNTTAKSPPSLRLTLAAAAPLATSVHEGDPASQHTSPIHTTVVALAVVAGVVLAMAMLCIGVALARRHRRRKHVAAAPLSPLAEMSAAKAQQFNIPVIMVSPPTIRSRLRASIVSLGYSAAGRRRSTASCASHISRPPSAVVVAREPPHPPSAAGNRGAPDDEKPLATLCRATPQKTPPKQT
ncbi:hypothetical protein SYNPS1DRAFT_26269 [Syncephalis pseudoplumigaleata]|uniref:Uncharacterized protein n=1 Tax=Syncephalis pseudoplumigaleata TaxID=1712513 RepID=A0A4P9Z6E0_9FUNG|nr:hypothetical protein SYNPS1DRAFT_26269 [Syncephalis pseudoplumigaleata]|eukprot:RKP28155.1 hypothetical protein SYNPS1DRAFT_26269 [Syncephalis pseudoplumigaleata]